MTKLLEKPFLRTLPIFYAQATATRLRRIVFSGLLLWALVDAILTFRDWHRGGLATWLAITALVLSLCLSLLFLGFLALAWDWLARRYGRATRN